MKKLSCYFILFSMITIAFCNFSTKKPFAFICIVDDSGSMSWEGRDPTGMRFEALNLLIERMVQKEGFIEILFNDKSWVHFPFAKYERESQREEWVKKTKPVVECYGMTNYLDALGTGLKEAKAILSDYQPILLFFTDGDIAVSLHEEENKKAVEKIQLEILPELINKEIPAIFVGIGEFDKTLLINMSSLFTSFGFPTFYEVKDGHSLFLTMNEIVSNIRKETIIDQREILAEKEEWPFFIPKDIGAIIIRLVSLQDNVSLVLLKPDGTVLDSIPIENLIRKRTHTDIFISSPPPGNWTAQLQNGKGSLISVVSAQDFSVSLEIPINYAALASDFPVYVYCKDAKTEIPITPDSTIIIQSAEVKPEKMMATLSIGNKTTPLQWVSENNRFEGTVAEAFTKQLGILQMKAQVSIAYQLDNDQRELVLFSSERTIQVVDFPILKLTSDSINPLQNQKIEIELTGGKILDADKKSLQVSHENDPTIKTMDLFWDGQKYAGTISFPKAGKVAIYPEFEYGETYQNSRVELNVIAPYFKIAKTQFSATLYKGREQVFEVPYEERFYSPDHPDVVIAVEAGDSPAKITVEKESGMIRIRVSEAGGFSLFQKLLGKKSVSKVRLDDQNRVLQFLDSKGKLLEENAIGIILKAPYPAMELSIFFSGVCLLLIVCFLSLRKRRIKSGQLLPIGKTLKCGKEKNSQLRVTALGFPSRAFKLTRDNDELNCECLYYKGIKINNELLPFNGKKRLEPGDSLAVARLLKARVVVDKSGKAAETRLEVHVIKHSTNLFLIPLLVAVMVLVGHLFVWGVLQKFGI